MEAWATRLREGFGTVDAFVYFNNDHQGCALRDAVRFGQHLVTSGVEVGHMPDITDEVTLSLQT